MSEPDDFYSGFVDEDGRPCTSIKIRQADYKSEREEFERWAVESGAAYRNHQGLWFYRNGGDGLYEAWLGGRAALRHANGSIR
jgi:hypothetical protein